ncbi:uncharacterized protein UTRI_03105 [Ustilago trichophora]|uniref:DUF7888 domain-containing protein n=1 Tax=Ustilago trichophora TaxID=86804 RepID=A0A5C3E6M0_9BASI|nr:uncharacterized protein UTRI_03105 [Ustilago trichophora]
MKLLGFTTVALVLAPSVLATSSRLPPPAVYLASWRILQQAPTLSILLRNLLPDPSSVQLPNQPPKPFPLLLPFPIQNRSPYPIRLPQHGLHKRHELHRLERRNEIEDCNKAQTEALWVKATERGPNHIRDLTAAVCYINWYHFEVDDKSKAHYLEAESHTCWKDNVINGYDAHYYTCMYLIGRNTFRAEGPGGFENLAMIHDGEKCRWNKDDRVLTCSE